MPLSSIAEGIFSIIGEFLSQIVFEVMVKGAGYFILRYIFQIGRKSELNPDGASVIITGIIFWLLVGFGGYKIWQAL